ncbi:hypothetical protein Nepgr_013565 [Nepenthes gracilis]|uniref:Uncharacterized protein n=1 Tax=Nepenthes gracilis TaxID=150966 RepID=A0AAD3SJ45_NEPGR|nr:hypothetical protein Nepgr_013565 [Nepenthes gracilis]
MLLICIYFAGFLLILKLVALGLEPRWRFAAVALPVLVPGAFRVLDPSGCHFLCIVVPDESDQYFIPAPSPVGCLMAGLHLLAFITILASHQVGGCWKPLFYWEQLQIMDRLMWMPGVASVFSIRSADGCGAFHLMPIHGADYAFCLDCRKMIVDMRAAQSGMSELPSCTDLKHPISHSLLQRLNRIDAVEDCSVTLWFTDAMLVAGHVVRQ